MTKKYSMFSNGTVVAHVGNGNVVKASQEEVAQHLATYLRPEYKGAKLSSVLYNPKNGCVYGKYADKTIKKQIMTVASGPDDEEPKICRICESANARKGDDVCQGCFDGQKEDAERSKADAFSTAETRTAQARQLEPINTVQKSVKDLPRNESKAKPETAKITKDRPDVANPKEVRKDEYKRGKGADDLHKDIPRSKSNGGLDGGSTAEVAAEEADKATSGKPDTYVQTLNDTEKPAKAGSEQNHTASTDIKFMSADSIYSPIDIQKKADKQDFLDMIKEKKENKEDKPKDKSEDKDKAKSKGAKDSEKDEESDDDKPKAKKEEGKPNPFAKSNKEKTAGTMFEKLYHEAKSELASKDEEINHYKVREARRASATKYALVMLNLNPAKYASVDAFSQLVEKTTSTMTQEAIENAVSEMVELQPVIREASTKVTIQAQNNGGLTNAFVIGQKEIVNAPVNKADELKEILMSGTKYGKMMGEFDEYTPHVKE